MLRRKHGILVIGVLLLSLPATTAVQMTFSGIDTTFGYQYADSPQDHMNLESDTGTTVMYQSASGYSSQSCSDDTCQQQDRDDLGQSADIHTQEESDTYVFQDARSDIDQDCENADCQQNASHAIDQDASVYGSPAEIQQRADTDIQQDCDTKWRCDQSAASTLNQDVDNWF